MNMLRHARYFKNLDGIMAHMDKQAELLRPKFKTVLDAFERELGGKGVAEWINPNGGYFISLNVMDGCAKRVVQLCKDAGVVLTSAGTTRMTVTSVSRRRTRPYRNLNVRFRCCVSVQSWRRLKSCCVHKGSKDRKTGG